MRYGNGIEHQGMLNARMLPSQLKDGTASELLCQYGANGDVSAITDRQQGAAHDIRMGYEGQGRLTLAQSASFGGDDAFRYTYDAQDNLLSVKLAGVRSQQFWYDARNQLTNVRDDAGATVTGLTWDVQGNLSLRNGRKYDFDFGNRLREVQEAERYACDAYGRRAVAYDAQGQRLRAMYSLAGKVVHDERRGKGASEYIHVGGRLLATRSPTGVTWMHVDALGSPVAVTDGTGSVVERRRFEPYGAELGGLVKDGLGYTGHVSDSATGLSYMQRRYMDPQLGVFLLVDPVTAYEQPVGQFNRYRYAVGNPYRYIDPDGRAESPAWMRYTIPGQATWDAAVTSAEQGNYGMATVGGAVAIAEGVVGIVTLGQSQRLTVSSQLVSREIAALSAVRSASAEAQASKAAGGGVTGLVTESGEVFVGASPRAGGPGGASNAAIQKSLDGVAGRARSPFHGCCGEIDAMSKALNSGANWRGGTMATVRAVGSKAGQVMELCTSCATVAKDQGVRAILPVNTPPL
ncbi:RHS repeat domain-containing protein [Stenotrophomonas maltophilia]|uniref:RHS repeat domain-containing protein n=2 Tax=Stenotrophomonas maltophilia TaxID=40324 RepID=UPI0021AC91CF|nr:RHS repeat-associated core domain-containing protein [Stenotrophomonas maltophilia]